MQKLIVFLHGLGDTGAGWRFLRNELSLPTAVGYATPDAPNAPVTCNGGHVMTSWMDLDTSQCAHTASNPQVAYMPVRSARGKP